MMSPIATLAVLVHTLLACAWAASLYVRQLGRQLAGVYDSLVVLLYAVLARLLPRRRVHLSKLPRHIGVVLGESRLSRACVFTAHFTDENCLYGRGGVDSLATLTACCCVYGVESLTIVDERQSLLTTDTDRRSFGAHAQHILQTQLYNSEITNDAAMVGAHYACDIHFVQLHLPTISLTINGKHVHVSKTVDDRACRLDLHLVGNGRDTFANEVRALAVAGKTRIDRDELAVMGSGGNELDLLVLCAHRHTSYGGVDPWSLRCAELVTWPHARAAPFTETEFVQLLQQYAGRQQRFGR